MAGKGDEVDLTGDVEREQEEKARRDAAFPAQTGSWRENQQLVSFPGLPALFVSLVLKMSSVSSETPSLIRKWRANWISRSPLERSPPIKTENWRS